MPKNAQTTAQLHSSQFSSVQFSRSVVSHSLRPHESQHARPPCPSPTPGVHSNSCPSSQWCHPAMSSSVVPFSSCPQSLPMLKILQARLQQYMNCELPAVQAGLEKAEEPEIKLSTSTGSSEKQESFRKTSISALFTMPKLLTVWITKSCGQFWKRWKYQTTWPASWENYMQVRKQQNRTWNNRLVPNRKRSTSRLYIVTLLI